ncbi:hypothetical protein B0A56_11985 [Flavobacterium columnare NBRC 100251 = ATCC 23463]|nr:hypothetical protein B0A56_11985 [Flavobacterium columnare NBRC 100251 = ATCC 23463]
MKEKNDSDAIYSSFFHLPNIWYLKKFLKEFVHNKTYQNGVCFDCILSAKGQGLFEVVQLSYKLFF